MCQRLASCLRCTLPGQRRRVGKGTQRRAHHAGDGARPQDGSPRYAQRTLRWPIEGGQSEMRPSSAIIESIVVESKVDYESIVERFERISQRFQIEIIDCVHRCAASESGQSLRIY